VTHLDPEVTRKVAVVGEFQLRHQGITVVACRAAELIVDRDTSEILIGFLVILLFAVGLVLCQQQW
jgi:hypothetical protein